MRRREFVAGGAALAVGAAAFPAWTSAQSASTRRIERIIDAHCHIFNAADLPIEGFARKVMVPKTVQTNELLARFAEYPGALEALVHAVAVQVKRGAPTSQEEIDAIDEFERNPDKKRTREWRREEDRRQLRSAFRLIWFNSEIFGSREPFTSRGPRAWNCDRARPAVSVSADTRGVWQTGPGAGGARHTEKYGAVRDRCHGGRTLCARRFARALYSMGAPLYALSLRAG